MTDELPLAGWRVAVPESRQLDVLNDMLVVRGASTLRCPLVSIHDCPDEAAIKAWLTLFCSTPFDDLIILTGEGIRRLTGFAERFGMLNDWIAALGRVRKIARGPKPASALRPHKLKPDVLAAAPTTDGVIETLMPEDLTGRRIAVQLYGEEPNEKLQSYLKGKGADISIVAPYVYASDVESSQVSRLLDQLIAAELDVLVLTSVVQVKRILTVAKSEQREAEVITALKNIHIAAIGPIVAQRLDELNIPIDVIPEDKFFMKPLVRKLVEFVALNPK
ncbi:uroporphyrinogen-III synthase [Marinagarivorans cellulosilyticus]|uniref:Uroporphyrinogen-III synthase n=1 Tax=Marinagarivorans cellulosilyticus TaxID=2721545 RepID=A0AAN1WFJ1_9GAMM|nr:uroporphyrinogen-III synthase [Marinagarivorans cellulosilyticus]BCD96666.1 uroporphyrinogen-III synthase [Marinagarivorans cellulosilyticus]